MTRPRAPAVSLSLRQACFTFLVSALQEAAKEGDADDEFSPGENSEEEEDDNDTEMALWAEVCYHITSARVAAASPTPRAAE